MTRLALESARMTRVDSVDGPVLIELQGSDGSTGLGEARALPVAFAAVTRLCASLIGMDVVQTTAIGARLAAHARDSGIPAAIVGGVECAVWDLVARHLRTPLHRLLGTNGRRPVVAPGIVRVDGSAESVDMLVERAGVLVDSHGHDALVIVIPSDSIRLGARALREIRRAFGAGMRTRVECSGESNAADVQSLLEDIDDLDVDYVADVAATRVGQACARRKCATPLASTVLPGDGLATWIEAGAGEVILGDAVSWGGVAAFRKNAAVCRAFSVDLAVRAPDALGPAIGTSLQLIADHSAANKGFHGLAESFGRFAVVTPAPVVQHGRLAIPEGPGIGWSVDPVRLSGRVYEQTTVTSPSGPRR